MSDFTVWINVVAECMWVMWMNILMREQGSLKNQKNKPSFSSLQKKRFLVIFSYTTNPPMCNRKMLHNTGYINMNCVSILDALLKHILKNMYLFFLQLTDSLFVVFLNIIKLFQCCFLLKKKTTEKHNRKCILFLTFNMQPKNLTNNFQNNQILQNKNNPPAAASWHLVFGFRSWRRTHQLPVGCREREKKKKLIKIIHNCVSRFEHIHTKNLL